MCRQHALAKLVTTAGADLVRLLSKGVTRINKISKFLAVTLIVNRITEKTLASELRLEECNVLTSERETDKKINTLRTN